MLELEEKGQSNTKLWTTCRKILLLKSAFTILIYLIRSVFLIVIVLAMVNHLGLKKYDCKLNS